MIRALLPLSIALGLSLQAHAGTPKTHASEAPEKSARDPLAVLSLADRLTTERRTDEAFAVLRSALDEPALVPGATLRLRDLLLGEAPRRAWALGYQSLLELGEDSLALKLHIAVSKTKDPSSVVRSQGLRKLDALLRAHPEDERVRIATGDAWLQARQPQRALTRYGQPKSPALRDRAVIASMMLGRFSASLDPASPKLQRCLDQDSPLMCASVIEEAGLPLPAAFMLERALRTRHPSVAAKDVRAEAWAEVGRIYASSDRTPDAIRAWTNSMSARPTEPVRRSLVGLLLNTKQPYAAKRWLNPSDDCSGSQGCLARTVEGVRLALSVNPNNPDGSTASKLRSAQALAPNHPVVVSRAATAALARGEAQAAVTLLQPHLAFISKQDSLLRLMNDAALQANRPDVAVQTWRAGMATATTPRTFARRLVAYAEAQAIAGESNKTAGQHSAARQSYQLALTPYPTNTQRLQGLAGVLWAGGDAPLAEVVYRRAWAIDASDTNTLRALIQLLHDRAAYAEAASLLRGHPLHGSPELSARAAEIRSLARTVEVERLRAKGQREQALERLEQLIAETPIDVRLLRLRAEILGEMGRHIESAQAFRMARSIDPEDDPGLKIGEIYALLAVQQVKEARELVDTLSLRVPGAAATERAVRIGEAQLALTEGRDEEGIITLMMLIEDDPSDPNAVSALSEAYASRGQLSPAIAWNQHARRLSPSDHNLHRRAVELRIDAGALDDAAIEVQSLLEVSPRGEVHTLVRRVERLRTIRHAARAYARDDVDVARRTMLDLLEAEPAHPDVLVAWARLQASLESTEDAWATLTQEVLPTHPTHAGALTAAAEFAQTMKRSADAVSLWRAAIQSGAPAWVSRELPSLELAAHLDEARGAHSRGLQASADELVSEAERWYGTADAGRQTRIGYAWLDIGRVESAISAFEVARRVDPSSTEATLGLSRALMEAGDPAAAELLLRSQWMEQRDASVGVRLAHVQRDRGRWGSARKTLQAVASLPEEERVGRLTPARQPLEVLALPDGREPADRLRPAAPQRFLADPITTAEATTSPPISARGVVGAGYARRPGDAGTNQLSATVIPVAAELIVNEVVHLRSEADVVLLDDGARQESGTGGSVGAALHLGGLTADGRLGTSPVGFTVVNPYATWQLTLNSRQASGLDLGIETARAPVTDSLTSWAGARDANGDPYGGAIDIWAGGQISYAAQPTWSLGATARSGHIESLGSTPDVPWRQAYGYGRARLHDQTNREIWAEGSALLLEHQRQVDGFGAGQAGVFSPERYWSAMARVEGLWGLDEGPWTACASAGAGPQQITGDQTLYLGPGTYAAYQLHGALKAAVGSAWMLYVHGDRQGTFGRWNQTSAMVQLRYGPTSDAMSAPSINTASPIHGPPLRPTGLCGATWQGWAP